MKHKIRGMILAAGEGTRLRPLTYIYAKPAIPFLGRPLIHYSLDLLESLGITEVAVNLHYLPETVKAALEGRKEKILFSHEETILGTGGCLGKLKDHFSGSTVVLCNGKIIFSDPGLDGALRQHFDSGAMVTMVLVPFESGMPFKKVFLDRDNNIAGFARNISSAGELKKIQAECGSRGFVYTGIQILNPRVFSYIPEGYSDTVADIYPGLIRDGYQLKGYVSQGTWRECSTPERYLRASVEMTRASGCQPPNGKWGNLSPEHGTFTGHSVNIPKDAVLKNCVVWDNSQIGSGSRFDNIIIAGTSGILPDGMQISNAVIAPRLSDMGVTLPQGVETGRNHTVWPRQGSD